MGFLSGLSHRAEPMAADLDPTDDRYYTNEPPLMSAAGRNVSPELSLRISAVYHCVNLLAKSVASLDVDIYQVDPTTEATTEAPNHPIADLLRYQPNDWQTAWDFKAMLMTHLCLRGNAYAEIRPGRRGAIDKLEPLHPDRVSVSRGSDRKLRYRVTDEYGETRVLLQDEVFHIRAAIAPGLVGISPITYARETIGLALAAEEYGARVFNNGARPSGVVTIAKRMSDAAFERFKAEWRSQYSGIHNSNKTPILEEGADFKPISMTSDDAQFILTRQFQIEEICRWFDVPPVMLHHTTGTTSWGTGVEAIMLAFVRNNLNPWLKAWTQAISRDLILAPKVYEARFNVEDLIAGDMKAKADFWSRLVLNGIVSRNEARHELGYNPKPGLDEPLTPSNSTTSDNLPGNGGGNRRQTAQTE